MIISGVLITSTLWTGSLFPVAALNESIDDKITTEIIALKASENRWIEINLSTQRLIAWEGKTSVYAVIISTGKKDTPTRPGVFKILRKVPLERMRGADYDVPNVPHTMYYDGGYAIHGAYWHHRFGTPVSHGCVNVALDHAEWLYEWASVGTAVIIHD
jgi:lipoprotein-anchoring transpeptidase ErfK/SrfK